MYAAPTWVWKLPSIREYVPQFTEKTSQPAHCPNHSAKRICRRPASSQGSSIHIQNEVRQMCETLRDLSSRISSSWTSALLFPRENGRTLSTTSRYRRNSSISSDGKSSPPEPCPSELRARRVASHVHSSGRAVPGTRSRPANRQTE